MNQSGKALIIVLIAVLVLVILGGVGYYLYYAGFLDGLLGRAEDEPAVVEEVDVTEEVAVPLNANGNANASANMNANANGNANASANMNANANGNANASAGTQAVVELTTVTYNDCFFLAESSKSCGTRTVFFARELGTEQLKDSDNDGIPDVLEKLFGLKANAADSDNDTYGDMEEILNGYNPGGEGEIEYEAKDTEQWVDMYREEIEGAGIVLPQ